MYGIYPATPQSLVESSSRRIGGGIISAVFLTVPCTVLPSSQEKALQVLSTGSLSGEWAKGNGLAMLSIYYKGTNNF